VRVLLVVHNLDVGGWGWLVYHLAVGRGYDSANDP
jgi:hypothetical protein